MQFLFKSIQKVLEFYLYSQNSKTSFFATFNFAKTPKYKSILHSHTFNNLYQPYVHCKGTWLAFQKMTSDWPLTSHLTFGATTWEPLFWHVQKGPKSGNFELNYLQKSARPTLLMHKVRVTYHGKKFAGRVKFGVEIEFENRQFLFYKKIINQFGASSV